MKNLIPLLLLLAMVSCEKEHTKIEMYWAETGCSDPWDTSSNNSEAEIEQAVIDFLENENIIANEVRFEDQESLNSGCEACHCTTGRKFIQRVKRKNRNKMLEIGFRE